MVEVHLVVSQEQQRLAMLGMAPTEFDILIAETDEFVGVIEPTDIGYMFTDTFGHLTMFDDYESVNDVYHCVYEMFNPPVMN